ncbi:MAG: RodZ domain-containing protein [Pseudomonadota bacterium]
MDEELVQTDVPRVGERLRAAREEKGLSLEDVAAQTRIPQRHLESIEASDWEKLPAPTYTVGFAKNYAAAVDLDRAEIGEALREEMGGQRFTTTTTEVFEPADPARTMPKWLVLGAIGGVILLVLLMSWLNNRSLQQPDDATNTAAAAPAPAPSAPAAPQSASAQGPVVLTATGPAWIQISDQGNTLFEGEMAPGQSYTVPANAVAPLLKAGKPESLRINVGSAVAPQVGPSGKVATKVSLLPADLMRGPQQPVAAPAAPAAPAPAAAPRRRPPEARAPVAPPPPAPQPAPVPTNSTGA